MGQTIPSTANKVVFVLIVVGLIVAWIIQGKGSVNQSSQLQASIARAAVSSVPRGAFKDLPTKSP